MSIGAEQTYVAPPAGFQLQRVPPPVLLPQLRANPEAAARSPLRLHAVLEQLANAVPRRFGGDVGGCWHLLFSTATDGRSLAHMLRTVAGDAALLLIVRCADHRVFGACHPLRYETQRVQSYISSWRTAGYH